MLSKDEWERIMRNIGRAIFLIALFPTVVLGGDNWSQSDKKNAEHFIRSLRFIVEASKISNKSGPGLVSKEEFEKILSLYQSALNEANLVKDAVLDKAHSELKVNYRMYFQKGIQLRISAWTNKKQYDEIQGSALLDSWGDWYEKNRNKIKIPY